MALVAAGAPAARALSRAPATSGAVVHSVVCRPGVRDSLALRATLRKNSDCAVPSVRAISRAASTTFLRSDGSTSAGTASLPVG